jgi:hypothetical protein
MASPLKHATFTGNSPLAPLMAQFIQEKRACGYLRKMLDVVLFPEIWSLRTAL